MNGVEDFVYGMRVIHIKTRRRGTVTNDSWHLCTPDEVPVEFDGREGYEGTDWRELLTADLGGTGGGGWWDPSTSTAVQ